MSEALGAARHRRPKRRFLWRVYLHGFVLLVLTGVAVFGVGRLEKVRTDPTRLQAELDRLKTEINISMTLYDASGAMIASNVEPPLASVPPEDLPSLTAELERETFIIQGDRSITAFYEGGRLAGFAVASRPPAHLPILYSAVVIAMVLVVLALASLPLARSVVSPVEKLARVTRSFGAGDMSARAHLPRKDEIGELARAFDEMADRVAHLLRSEKELLANVSHELRTPLARIRVVLDLASEVDAARSRRYLGEIAEDLAELERLVDDVLTATRLDLAEGKAGSGAPPVRRSPTDVRALIEKATAKFQERYPERSLHVEGAEDLPSIDADGPMLRRVLDNLLDNARKYSDAGSPIRVAAHSSCERLTIEVMDEGIGIEPTDHENVFAPFFRSDRSRARRTGGVGLGLTLARRIVEAHGGEIALSSKPSVGTTVRFTVPLRADPSPSPSRRQRRAESREHA